MSEALPTVKGQLLTPLIAQTAGYEILEASGDRQAQKDYLMRHGTVQTRAEAGLPELPAVCPRKRNQQSA